MRVFSKQLFDLTAADIMSRDVVTIPVAMSLHAAAHRLDQFSVSGAPVIDDQGRCVGVLSKTDIVRFIDQGVRACPRCQADALGCFGEWQVIELEDLPVDAVARYMSTQIVAAGGETPMWQLARMMHDAQVHRVLVCDSDGRIAGVVSSMDVLGALACQETTACWN